MKRKGISAIATFTVVIVTILMAFKKNEAYQNSETCSEWTGKGIQFRQCSTNGGHRNHQFFNGYSVKVLIYYHLNYTDGGYYDGNYTISPTSETGKIASDGSSGTNKVVGTWQVTKKLKEDATGKWVEF